MGTVLRVLVVDDSAYVRKVVKQMLSRSPFIEVVGTARDGREALERVQELEPDVVTCDLIMPEMDGVEFVREQMMRRPVPIIIMTIANETGEMALTALDAGAVDFIQKPTALATERIFEVSDELIDKVKAAAEIPLSRLPLISVQSSVQTVEPAKPPMKVASGRVDLVAIGVSTGGPQALKYIVPRIPSNFPVPIAVVMHMPVGYTEMYARKLDEQSELSVTEAREGDVLTPGALFLAPAGRHLTFLRSRDGTVTAHLDARPFDTLHRPSVDVMFQSAADIFGSNVLGVVMTGMGSDGKQGAAWIKAQGGLVYTESEETCIVYGMPSSVVEAGLSDRSIPLDAMADAIKEAVWT
jgi:two-component system, chemotaxis family, protein-glutamate methylesterase/glutaminase